MESVPVDCPVCLSKNGFKLKFIDEKTMIEHWECQHTRLIDGVMIKCGYIHHVRRYDLPPPDYESLEKWRE